MKKLNLLPKPLSIEDVIRHGDLLKPLETLYDGVQFSATLSLLTSILCFCDDNEDEIAGGNDYFESMVEDIFEATHQSKRKFMDIMSECVDLNRKGILVLHDMGNGGVSYEFSKRAFNHALKSITVH